MDFLYNIDYSKLNIKESIKLYHQIIIYRRNNKVQEQYYEKHHIIPRALAKNKKWINADSNIIEVTFFEHFICHYLLYKIFPDNNKIIYGVLSFILFDNKSIGRKKHQFLNSINILEYKNIIEDLKLKRMKLLKSQTGRNNPNFGHNWTYEQKLSLSLKKQGKPNPWINRENKRTNEEKQNMKKGWKIKIENGYTQSIEHRISNSEGNIGKKIFHNIITHEVKKFKPNEEIPEGWIKGYPKNYMKSINGKIRIYNKDTFSIKYIQENEEIPEGWIKGTPNKKIKILCLNNNKIYNTFAEARNDTRIGIATIKKICDNKIDNICGYKFKKIIQ